MIGLREVRKLAFEQKVSEQAIERDYVLTWILIELARHATLGDQAVLKGGTALKKLYYPQWRYSEDLDFTLAKAWTKEAIATGMREACASCVQSAGLKVDVASEEPPYQGDHLRNVTIYVAYIGPLRKTRRRRELKVDFTADEVLVAKPVHRPLNRMYSDEPEPPCPMLSYSLEEILAEKMRTILQRTEPRDLYDVWRLLGEHGNEMNLEQVRTIFAAKCRFKGLTFSSWNDFLPKDKITKYEAAWERRLGEQVRALLPVKTVMREMRQLLRSLF